MNSSNTKLPYKIKIKEIKIDIAMAKAGIKTYTELSKNTNISRITIHKYLTPKGFETITFGNLLILCNALKCGINDIVELEEIED